MVFKRRAGQPERQSAPRRDRRSAPRQPIGWESRYAVRDDNRLYTYLSEADQAPCVVHDLSVAGAGLRLAGPEVEVGDCVVLDLNLTEHRRAASIRLTAVVRHARTDDEGRVRAGVEFVEVGNLERALLLRLVEEQGQQMRRAG